jgi:hypothetical protein
MRSSMFLFHVKQGKNDMIIALIEANHAVL